MKLDIPHVVYAVPSQQEILDKYGCRVELLTRLYERAMLRTTLSERQNHRCCYCGGIMNDIPNSRLKASVEHVIPESRGGNTDLWNCVAAHSRCNSKRGNAFIAEEVLVFIP